MALPTNNETTNTDMLRQTRILTLALAFTAFAFSGLFIPGLNKAHAALPALLNNDQVPSLAPMLENVLPAVVNINTTSSVSAADNPLFQDEFYRRFFGVPDGARPRQAQSLGSGVIIDAAKGYVVTNHHVVEGADKISVTLTDGRTLDAKLIGSDKDSDVGVIQVEPDNLVSVDLGDSESLRVGDFVVAIGNPFGVGQSASYGIVSAIGRSGVGLAYENFIQTDAAINQGNSGGALVDLTGKLVGINTAILSRGGGNVGIGFAIPTSMLRRVVDQLVEYGEVRRGKLGVYIQDLTSELAEALGTDRNRGAVVSQVIPGSPAEAAGIQDGDIIIDVNGRDIRSAADLRNNIGLLRVGSEVDVVVVRSGNEIDFRIVIESVENLAAKAQTGASGQSLGAKLAGASFRSVTAAESGLDQGAVQVVEVDADSPAAQSGLMPDDIITSVNRVPVSSVEDMRAAITTNDDAMLLNIRRGSGAMFLVIR